MARLILISYFLNFLIEAASVGATTYLGQRRGGAVIPVPSYLVQPASQPASQPQKVQKINDSSDMTCSENPGLSFFEVCEAPQARCSEEQSYFSDMTCSENPEPVFSEVFEAPQARCSGAKYLIIHRLGGPVHEYAREFID